MSDNPLYIARCHWAILLGPIMTIFIGLITAGSSVYHSLPILSFGILWGVFSYKSLTKSEIRLNNEKISINMGALIKRDFDIPLKEINLIDFYQPSLGSMLNFGKITIVYNKEKRRCIFRFIKKPTELVEMVQKQVGALGKSTKE